MNRIGSKEQMKAVADMKREALRFISKLDELAKLQIDDERCEYTYQFKERSAVQRASLDLKRCMTENIRVLYGRR